MVIINFTECLNKLDEIIVNNVDVNVIKNVLEKVREYVLTYYKIGQECDVFEVLCIINYLLGNVESDYIKKEFS